MKTVFKYIGVVALAMFSFYYTDRVIELSKVNDAIMVSINEYAQAVDTKCSEGYITDEGIVLGISGITVDKYKSYSNMKGVGYKQELIEYKTSDCILTKENNLDKYILKGNPLKNSISIVIILDSGKYIGEIYDIISSKDIKVSYMMSAAFMNYNMVELKNYYDKNFLFSGKSKEELDDFIDNLKEFDKEYELFCVDNNSEILDICKEEKLSTIKIDQIIEKDLLSNVKRNLKKGDIIFIKESHANIEELSSTINYITGKGIKIIDLKDLLK